MAFKTLASPIALATAAALTLASGAFAQTMVGDVEVSDEDLPAVTEHCEMLAENDTATDEATDEPAGDTAGLDADTADSVSPEDGVNDMTAEGSMAADDAAGDEPMAGEMPTNDTMAGEMPTSDVMADEMAVDDTLMIDAITLEDCQAAGLIE